MALIRKGIYEVRMINEITRLYCDNGQQPLKYNVARIKARYDLASQSTVAYVTFNPKVLAKIKQFIVFDEHVPNLCAPGAPGDQAWHAQQEDIFQLFEEQMNTDQLYRLKFAQAGQIKTLNSLNESYYNLPVNNDRKLNM